MPSRRPLPLRFNRPRAMPGTALASCLTRMLFLASAFFHFLGGFCTGNHKLRSTSQGFGKPSKVCHKTL